MKSKILALTALLLLLIAGAALAAEVEYYQNQTFPPDEVWRANFDTKDNKFVQSLGRWREADDKYVLWYVVRYQERPPAVSNMTVFKLDSNLWIYQYGQTSAVVQASQASTRRRLPVLF